MTIVKRSGEFQVLGTANGEVLSTTSLWCIVLDIIVPENSMSNDLPPLSEIAKVRW